MAEEEEIPPEEVEIVEAPPLPETEAGKAEPGQSTGDPKQKLFLLEFIVDDINLDFCNTKRLLCIGEGKIVIEFKFLDIGPLRIIEDDFAPVKKHYLEGCTGTGNIKNGKSILFGLTPEQSEDVKAKTIIYCDIFKKTEKREYHLGACMIPIINMFKELLALVDEGGQSLYFKNIKDCFKIKEMTEGDLVGHVFAYIRMSCFNEIIVNKIKKESKQEVDYTPEKGYYNYKYGKKLIEQPTERNICECITNKSTNGICKCPTEGPADNCQEIYTDDKCVYDCPPSSRPCAPCPETCATNKAAGKVRQRELPNMQGKMASKHSSKRAKNDKKAKKPKKKK